MASPIIATQARSALLAATMFLIPGGAFAGSESPWSLPKDMRISDGMGETFADGRKLVVDGSGAVVVFKLDGKAIFALEKSEDLAGLVSVGNKSTILALVHRFVQKDGGPVAAIGARLVVFETTGARLPRVKSVDVEKVFGKPWNKVWVTEIEKSHGNSFKLRIGSLGDDGVANYRLQEFDLSHLGQAHSRR